VISEAAPEGQRPGDVPAIAICAGEVGVRVATQPPRDAQEMHQRYDRPPSHRVARDERDFLELWHTPTPPEYPPTGPSHLKHVLIVDKGDGAQTVEAQLRNVGLMDPNTTSIEAETGGFSAFVRGSKLNAILSAVLLIPEREAV
jgi:hypothetical protein